jgi:hypothetical protein
MLRNEWKCTSFQRGFVPFLFSKEELLYGEKNPVSNPSAGVYLIDFILVGTVSVSHLANFL